MQILIGRLCIVIIRIVGFVDYTYIILRPPKGSVAPLKGLSGGNWRKLNYFYKNILVEYFGGEFWAESLT